MEPAVVSDDGVLSLLAGLRGDRPDQFRLDGQEERLDHGMFIAVSASAP